MTTAVRPKELWNTMPGWGIIVDLTPPELIAARKVRVVRRALAVGLVIVLLLSLAAFGYAWTQKRSAADDLASVQNDTTRLQSEQNRYGNVVRIQSATKQIQSQIAGLMAADVDSAQLLGQIRAQLPANMIIGQLSVVANESSTSNSSAGGALLDGSGLVHIGTVSLSGTAKRLTDVATFVDRLGTIKGIVQPYPADTVMLGSTVTFSLQLTLTSDLLTHTYDGSQDGK
jgi:type IV pilus assembly protein PilN